ncbi:MAG: Gfo/Idh/MocA family oxidoreductase [Fimbriimonadaceae bacterium]|nr:Gfo/Idh/MocA family oxidoreductase [Fimbriimonadaceae bacterium]
MARIGILGRRGLSRLAGLRSVPGIEIGAFYDPETAAQDEARRQGLETFARSEAEAIESSDGVVVGTPMHLHADQVIRVLQAGRHVDSEVTAAVSLEECLRIAEAARSAPTGYFFAENYVYFPENLIVEALVRQGRFGSLTYGGADYVHDVRGLAVRADGTRTWRADWQYAALGNTYITHELGPLMTWFRAADPDIRIESVACQGNGAHAGAGLTDHDSTTTLIRLTGGPLLVIRLDLSSPRPHRATFEVQGRTGCYDSREPGIWMGEDIYAYHADFHRGWHPVRDHLDAVPSGLRAEIAEAEGAGHHGSDWFTGRRFGQMVLGERPAEIGLFEAMEWTVAGLLTARSLAAGGAPVSMEDWVYDLPRGGR